MARLRSIFANKPEVYLKSWKFGCGNITVTNGELNPSVWLDQANYICEEIWETQIFLQLGAPSMIAQTFFHLVQIDAE